MHAFVFRLSVIWLVSIASAAEPAGLFVAVGHGGRRISSHDGWTWKHDQRWSDEAKDHDHALFNIAFGHGRFIAVGGGPKVGRILSTRDGVEWKELPRQTSLVGTVAFGGGRFVAADGAGLLCSNDGETFTPGARFDVEGSVHARRSAYGSGEGGPRFVIIGDVDLAGEQRRVGWRASTEDGATFTSTAFDTTPARDVAHGAGHFVVVGQEGLIESSHDGQTWTRREAAPGEDFSRIVWTGKRFLVSGGKTAWSSSDGLTWQREPAGIPCALAWAEENNATLGIGFLWGGSIHLSRDFAVWKTVPIPVGPSLEAVARASAP